MEEIIGQELPPSAKKHPQWWENDSSTHPQAQAWISAGWQRESIDLGKSVTLKRVKSSD